jgi:hypothetical protein
VSHTRGNDGVPHFGCDDRDGSRGRCLRWRRRPLTESRRAHADHPDHVGHDYDHLDHDYDYHHHDDHDDYDHHDDDNHGTADDSRT